LWKKPTKVFSGWSAWRSPSIVKQELLKELLVEANELLAIFAAAQRTAKGNR
jgi:hypothetical protein